MSISRRLCYRPPRITLSNVDQHLYSDRRTLLHRQRLLREHTDSHDQRDFIGSKLLEWIADTRNLHAAWHHLEREGGQAPGMDGVTYDAVSASEKWELLNALKQAIIRGVYRPSEDKRVRIAKSDGRYRTLAIQNIVDRVVGRAIQQITAPLVASQLYAARCTHKATGDRVELLASVEHYIVHHRFRYAVTNDITDAFDHVPRHRMMQLLPRLIPSPPVIELIERVTKSDSRQGVRQGSPLSPLLLDIYLDHSLLRRWLRLRPGLPLFRYMDDLLVLCRTAEEAHSSASDLDRLVRDAGFAPKLTQDASVTCLNGGSIAKWLGMDLRIADAGLVILPDASAWQQLGDRLAECHEGTGPALAAREVMLGWIGQLGPCYDHMNHRSAYQRVVDTSRAAGLEEAVEYQHVQAAWQSAHTRWLRKQC